jgi:SAM-dependent methyltransferase
LELEEVRRNWDRFAATDPLWAIHSQDDKKGNGWSLVDFMATGTLEIDQLMSQLDHLEVSCARDCALDFGCGVGRLTQALAAHFGRVIGVDISATMLEQADAYNSRGARCTYVLNQSDDLAVFGDNEFDLIYSNVTLQHVPPKLALGYIREFVRVLRPDGLLVFQLPSRFVQPPTLGQRLRAAAPAWVRSLKRRLAANRAPQMLMNGVVRERVIDCVERAGGRLVAVLPDGSAPGWQSYRYVVRGEGATSR